MTENTALHFEVARTNLRETRFVEGPLPTARDLAAGEVLLAVDAFAFTANNVTYGVLGESFSYFSFFPAAEGWCRIPAWGFAEAVLSENEDVPVGTRYFGYFPMSSHVKVKAKGAPDGFTDVAEHRLALPPIYNRYQRVSPSDPDTEARLSLFRPLFGTAFLLDDWLAEERFFGGKHVVLTSASAKTAFCLAALIARREGRPRIVGLTSPANSEFVRSLGVYDDVLLYDAIGSLPREPTLVVDVAGNEPVLVRVHEHLSSELVYSCRVGASHWEERGDFLAKSDWPGKTPEFFFAPTRAQELSARWGAAELQAKVQASLLRFLSDSRGGWLRIVRTRGRDIEAVYRATLEGTVHAGVGNILSLR